MATIKEIAARAGVSPSTVSIILRGNARQRHLSEQTEQRVRAIAAELGYQPNLSARQLRGQEQQPVFVALYLADDFRTPMMLRFLYGLREEMRGHAHWELVIRLYEPGRLTEATGPEVLRLFHAAIICNATEHDLRALEEMRPKLPVVLYNRASPVFPSVMMDNGEIGRLPARVFAAHGRRRAVYLNSQGDYGYLHQRLEAFCQEAAALGLEVTVRTCVNSMEGGAYAARALRADRWQPDCVLAASDRIAIGALRGLEGISIPRDLELISIGNGDREIQEYTWPALSVVALPMEEMARRCFAKIREQLAGGQPVSEMLPVQYLPRITCGPWQPDNPSST